MANGIRSLAASLFAIRYSPFATRYSLQLLHLPHLELHPGWPAEDRNRDLEPGAPVVDLLDHAVEGGERSFRDPHLLAHLEGDRGLRPLDAFLHLVQNALGLGIRDRLRLLVGAEEAG